ncbi:hypothetical protein I7X12_10990 [Halosimplex litoreum]|uniref:Uncharacterized protein n=1 Tax=Halosimplex litoreum TaxID=1198301 RepID=A0A7T3FV92_9EURY|nr:hypothetical protein [Halosimplex litoreum]QPV61296.1 hypothetical protein I7X12_10990 [Halosimplex litoreum]
MPTARASPTAGPSPTVERRDVQPEPPAEFVAAAGTIGTAVGVACASAYVGCSISDVIRENTPCGAQYVDVFVPTVENVENTYREPPAALAVVRCTGDIDPGAIASDIQSELGDAWDDAQDVASDLIDGIGNIFNGVL